MSQPKPRREPIVASHALAFGAAFALGKIVSLDVLPVSTSNGDCDCEFG